LIIYFDGRSEAAYDQAKLKLRKIFSANCLYPYNAAWSLHFYLKISYAVYGKTGGKMYDRASFYIQNLKWKWKWEGNN